MENLNIPPNTVIPINKDELATSNEIRTLTKRGGDNFIKVPYDKITVRPGHNGRTEDNPGFSEESLEELAVSIFHLGLLEPLGVDVLKNGSAVLTKGERRWRAIGMIRKWIATGNLKKLISDEVSAENREFPSFDSVECFTKPKHYNENDRIVAMLVENT